MNETSDNGHQPDDFMDHWCNDEVPIEIGPQHIQPPQPITGRRLENLKTERALRARLDPTYRAHLESRGIFLTPEELEEPPTGNLRRP